MKSGGTVFVVDDDAALRRALMRLLAIAGYTCEAFASAEAFLQRPHFEGPACLLLDVHLQSIDGLELQSRLDQLDRHLSIVFITGQGDIPLSVRAIKKGAVNFLIKPVDDAVLIDAIEEALKLSQQTLAQAREKQAVVARSRRLSNREFEVMEWVIAGALNKQIGARLGIAEKTVKAHRSQVMQKMEASSVAELVRMCAIAGIKPKGP